MIKIKKNKDKTNIADLECPECEEEYSIKWYDEEIEPTTCPFCGAESLIEEEDAYFEQDKDDISDWN
jgi:Zn ribbon nucleic-acid-binding protein